MTIIYSYINIVLLFYHSIFKIDDGVKSKGGDDDDNDDNEDCIIRDYLKVKTNEFEEQSKRKRVRGL